MWGFQHPWFRPLWRRVLVVAVCLGWGLFELISGAPFWAILFLAMGAVAIWELFLRGPHAGKD